MSSAVEAVKVEALRDGRSIDSKEDGDCDLTRRGLVTSAVQGCLVWWVSEAVGCLVWWVSEAVGCLVWWVSEAVGCLWCGGCQRL